MVILNASDPDSAKKMNDIIKNAKHVFILVYMVGCGPCNATRPEWKKMCQSLENKYSSNNDVAILDLDSKFMNEVNSIGEVQGFPTMKYISDRGNAMESFEDSNIPDKQRSSSSFVDWIESKILPNKSSKSSKSSKSKMTVNDLSRLISSKQPHSSKTYENITKNKSKLKTKSKMNKKNKNKKSISKNRKMKTQKRRKSIKKY